MSYDTPSAPAREALLRLTRQAIVASVRRQSGPGTQAIEACTEAWPLLKEPAGAFVTIYVDDDLRGCLGEILAEKPVLEVILRCASRVPLCDTRFEPVHPWELDQLSFKISILSPPEPVYSLEEIQLGRDGLIVRHGDQVGLLLPEVPVEHGWDLPIFLKHLWLKAGLPASMPVEEARLWRFSSQVISSSELAPTL